ncbi:hypothetical protein [Amycolatopsis sp. GA6-003]|uniref:hypothetical protein n=1 Tax=Amycolatopsis sp. GA6-003 TaxID=2652444 RepID=UPI00391743F5
MVAWLAVSVLSLAVAGAALAWNMHSFKRSGGFAAVRINHHEDLRGDPQKCVYITREVRQHVDRRAVETETQHAAFPLAGGGKAA